MKRSVTLVLNCLRTGGAEKQLLWMSSEIVSSGLSCCILELTAGERTERTESMVQTAIARGVVVLRAPAGSGSVRGFGRLLAHLRTFKPDLVWSWGLRADGLCLLSRLCRPRRKWLTSVRCANRESWLLGTLPRSIVARFCDGVVSNTHAGLVTSGVNGRPHLRKWVLSNAVPPDPGGEVALPEAPPERLVLVMLGNIKIAHKGYDLAVQVAGVLQSRNVSFELRIAGRLDEMDELQPVIRRIGVQSVVNFFGEVSHPEEFLRQGHLFLLLSRYEGMPNTLLEALNAGLPAIATDVGDLRVLKQRGAPFELIPIENVAAAVEAVESAIAKWPGTRTAAAQGRRWVQDHFSEETCRKVLRQILVEVFGA